MANERLRAQRLAKGWSQEDVVQGLIRVGIDVGEKQLGVTRNLISRWEREGSIPRAPYPKLLCLLFETSAEELGLVDPGSIPHTFTADTLGGLWVTSFQFNSEKGMRHHADITRITPQSSRLVTARNYPPDPRTQGQVLPFRNEIEAQLANRHLIGHWRNTSDTRYFGSIHLAVLPGEAVMEGYYTGFSSDIEVDSLRWKWVRLDPVSLSGIELEQTVLKEPGVIYGLVEHLAYDAPLTLTDVIDVST